MQQVWFPRLPGMLAPQHMQICALLYKRIVQPTRGPVAGDAERRAYIEAVCEQATSDVLCCSMENGLGKGDAPAEHVHVLTERWPQLPPVLRGLPGWQATWSTMRGRRPSKPSRPSLMRTPGTTMLSVLRSMQRWAPRGMLAPACSLEWRVCATGAPEHVLRGCSRS